MLCTYAKSRHQFDDLAREVLQAISPRLAWSSKFESSSRALSVARGRLQSLDYECSDLSKLDFPSKSDADSILENISGALTTLRTSFQSLEDMVREVVHWEKRCPDGGTLLHKQLCVAANGQMPLEWSAGLLYISTGALLFESADYPSWHEGPVKWDQIESLERCQDGDHRLHIKGVNRVLMLSGINNTYWLEKLGGLVPCTSVSENADGITDASDCYSFCTAVNATMSEAAMELWPALSAHQCMHVVLAATLNGATAQVSRAARMQEPVFSQWIPGVSFELVRGALYANDNWPVQTYLEQELHARDAVAAPWAASRTVSGTHLRRLRCRLPLPADVPQAAKALARLPEDTDLTMLARISGGDDIVVLVQEVVSHDVAFGDNFYVAVALSFRAHPDGGVLFEQHVDVHWVTPLPWYAGFIGNFVEQHARFEGKAAGSFWTKYLRDNCTTPVVRGHKFDEGFRQSVFSAHLRNKFS